ncbi:MAG: FAD-binding oxidoreductase [Alphaproteobacteria bacterium]|nr:FAD-binding oxidoreductase [Alphaproteobacteria bacterium]
MRDFDVVLIGAGIAGASAGFFLAAAGKRCALLEREERPGYHSTGRSAALYAETYGNRVVRAITTAAKPFYFATPAGFAETPLVSPRGTLIAGWGEQAAEVDRAYAEFHRLAPSVKRLDAQATMEFFPVLRREGLAGAVYAPEDADLDVDAIHQGFLRGFRRQGGELICAAEVKALARQGGRWRIETGQGAFAAPVVINAAGAWCDVVAKLAGLAPVGLSPKRRTAFIFNAPTGLDCRRWPAIVAADESWYIKPEAGNLLGSPANENPVEPHDVQPEELDVALGVDRIENATTLKIGRVNRKWAGLRSFVADKTLVAGFDPKGEGFCWCAGQGGYGIQTAPAMGRIVASLAQGLALPEDVRKLGVTAADLSPARFARS